MAKKKWIPNIPGTAGQVIKGFKDVITQPLYDTLDIANGANGDFQFFTTPISTGKTLFETNLRSAGEIERGKLFWLYGFSYYFNTSRIIGDDYEDLIGTGKPYITFTLLDKVYWESPLIFIPAFTGYFNADAITNTDTVTPFNQIKYLALSKPIKIWGKQSFSLKLTIQAALTLSKTYAMTFYLHGTMARNIQ